jgi:hypothetical protein
MFIDAEHLLLSITSTFQPNKSINYTHIPHPIRSTAPAPHMTCSIELSSITPAPFLVSVGLGVRLAVTVTVTAGRGMLLDFVVELVVVAIVVEKESVDAIVFVFVCVFEADGVESVFVKEWNGYEMLKSKADAEAAKRRKARGQLDLILNQESYGLIGEFG